MEECLMAGIPKMIIQNETVNVEMCSADKPSLVIMLCVRNLGRTNSNGSKLST